MDFKYCSSVIEDSCKLKGLSSAEAQQKQRQFSANDIPEDNNNAIKGVLKRLWGPVPWLLEAAMIFELCLGKGIQAAVVFLLLLFSAVTGEIQERRAKKAIGYLHQQLQIKVRVLRNGLWQEGFSAELVPGDIVHVRLGDIVSADMKIIQGAVSVNEAVITGESAELTKSVQEKLVSGSTISRGEAIAEVTATGDDSSYGKTLELVRNSEAPGRLQTLLFTVVRYLAYLDVILIVILVAAAFYRGVAWQELLPFLVILFIATIPISMPSSFVVANSLEAQNLAKQHILVSGLTGIQEAASMDILLIDKTGTLTNNQSEISQIIPLGTETEAELLQLAMAASDETAQDTISQAIFQKAAEQNLRRFKKLSFTAFDPDKKWAKAEIEQNGKKVTVVLGSPTLLAKFSKNSQQFSEKVEKLSANGARVVALAVGESDKLNCVGLFALTDLPRADARAAIAEIQAMGVRVMMLTGDSLKTAQALAKQVGLGTQIARGQEIMTSPLSFDGFAEIYPEDKYDLVKQLQELGFVVGMTGDGINDAPALKQADVGIAVSSARDVAKAAAKIVLTEPPLFAIKQVIESGHRVYRRMMTWTITKLARTAELAALLTFGFIFTGFFPVSLSLIVFIVVMNDLVTLTLGTDQAWSAKKPEKWRLTELSKLSAIFALGWLILGLGLIAYYLLVQGLNAGQISSLMFLYLIFSAMETILLTRTSEAFWSFAPSKWLAGMILFNLLLASLLAGLGWLTSAVSLLQIVGLFIITVITMLILDRMKIIYYRRTKILGN